MQRVLIIERDAQLRRDLLQSLRVSGWEADAVSGLGAAFAWLEGGSVDIVLLDLGVPADPARLAELIDRTGDLPVVATASEAGAAEAVAAMKRGATTLLRKPFGLRVLEEALLGSIVAGRPSPRRAAPLLSTGDPRMSEVVEQLENAASSDATVRIRGESGTGKDILARFVHRRSARRAGPLVAVNCASLSGEFVESELFGYERGVFPDAVESRPGQIESAAGGTLLLDEISELPLGLQPKLLRVLQEREVLRQGSLHPRQIDVRVIVTTRHDLVREVEAGRFRADLHYRLDVINVHVPPLRERLVDLPMLARHFLDRFAEAGGMHRAHLSPDALRRLSRHPFPGNLRELENLMQRAALLFPGREVAVDQLYSRTPASGPTPAEFRSRTLNLREIERQAVAQSLIESGGSRKRASQALGISPRTLRNKIRQYSLR